MPIPDVKGGAPSGRDKINQSIKQTNQLETLRGDEQFITVRKGPGGATVALNINNVLARIPKAPLGLFVVTVLEDGGAAGDASTQCSFTYTVKDILGNTMQKNATGTAATGMTPEFNLRSTTGACTKAPDNSEAIAFYDGTNLVLWMTLESRDPAAAVVQSGIRKVYLDWSGAGSDGDGTTAATWTYDVYADSGHGTLLASAQAPDAPRVLPSVNTKATLGLGDFDTDGEFVSLVQAFESYPMDACS